jgi:hypothetical protein
MQHVVLRDKARLDVDLRELRLPVGSQVLVAEAAGHLEVPVVTIFFLSFRVGAKMLLMDIAAAIRNFVCPPVVSAMNRPNAIVYTTTRTYWLVMTVLVTGLYCLELAGGGLM